MTREVILILGKTGSGKSTLAKKVLRRFPRVVILDPLFEYKDGVVVTNVNEFVDEVARHSGDWKKTRFKIVCRFTSDEDIEKFFHIAYELHDYLLMIDEAEIYLNPKYPHEGFSRIVSYGRHREISLLCIARRVPEVSIKFRAQVNLIYSFVQTEPNDLRVIEGYGLNPDEVQRLEKYKFVMWSAS